MNVASHAAAPENALRQRLHLWMVLPGLSLLLFAAVALALVVSYVRPTAPSHGVKFGGVRVGARHGQLLFTRDADRAGVDAEVPVSSFAFSQVTVRPYGNAPPSVSVAPGTPVATSAVGQAVLPGSQLGSAGTVVPAAGDTSVSSIVNLGSTSAGSGWTLDNSLVTSVNTTVLFPGVYAQEQFDFPKTLTFPGGGWIGPLQTLWRRTDVSLVLPLLATAVLPLLAVRRAVRESLDRRLAARLGVREPFVRVGRLRPAPPLGIGRRLSRALLALPTLLSLVALLALLAAWAYSYRPGGWRYERGPYPDDSLRLSVVNGSAEGSRNRIRPSAGPEVYHDHYVLYLTCGVSTYTGPNFYSWSFRTPLWAPAALAAVLPAAWFLRRHRRRVRNRVRNGLCPACAYDLRATPGRCPECGTAVVCA